MNILSLPVSERELALMKPIVAELLAAGGQLQRSEIKTRIIANNEDIAEFANVVRESKQSGKKYRPFDFSFNFAIKNLVIAEIIESFKRGGVIQLTEKGLNIDISTFDAKKDIYPITNEFWLNHRQQILENQKEDGSVSADLTTEETASTESNSETYMDELRSSILDAISKMSPKRFEMFSRQLISEMGVTFDEVKGVNISNDGGIDGYGYHMDPNDFRTTRVVIQCKRYNSGSVSEPEMNQFLGAMSKYRADYGIFITNSRFTEAAKKAATAGVPVTMIDGERLVDLILRLQFHVTPVTVYEMDDSFYYEEERI